MTFLENCIKCKFIKAKFKWLPHDLFSIVIEVIVGFFKITVKKKTHNIKFPILTTCDCTVQWVKYIHIVL